MRIKTFEIRIDPAFREHDERTVNEFLSAVRVPRLHCGCLRSRSAWMLLVIFNEETADESAMRGRTGRRAPSRGVGTHVRGVRRFRGRSACGATGVRPKWAANPSSSPRTATCSTWPGAEPPRLPTCFRSRGSVPAGPNATARRSSPCSARLPTRISTECPEAGSCRKNGCGSEFFHIFVAIQLNFGKDENETDCLRGAADDGVLRKSVGRKAAATKTEVKHGPEIALVAPDTVGGTSVNEALANRRSWREYAAAPLTLEELSGVVWAARRHQPPRYGPSDGSFGAGALSGARLCVFRRGRLFLRRPGA